MDKELVSVIITTHNRAPAVVLRALNSAINQTYNNLEIIVIDDSTNDYQYREEVEKDVKGASEKILYVKNKSNRGACYARNVGLEYAKGYYVAFLDDDDEWLPTKIEEQIKGFTDDSIALVYSRFRIIDEISKREYNSPDVQVENDLFFTMLLRDNIIGNTSNPLLKRACVNEVGKFDLEMQACQDIDLWLRLVNKYSVSFVDKVLLKYYIHDGKRISTDVDRRNAGLERLITKYHNYYKRDNFAWYMSHRALLQYYLIKYGRRRSFSLWIKCVKKMPCEVIKNIKDLFLVALGPGRYSSIVNRVYYISRR